MDSNVELIHRIVAYPLAFVLAPLALLTFAGGRTVGKLQHRSLGRWYFYGMTFLYITGTFLTLTRHPWESWQFGRNVAFNFLGFLTVPLGVRAIVLFRSDGSHGPRTIDYVLAALLTVTTVTLGVLSFIPGLMMRAFFGIAVVLTLLEWRELRSGFAPRELLYRRHIRYILASYFYVLTVASIVHLGDELPRNAKWLWPSVFGAAVICMATASDAWWRRLRPFATRTALMATIVIALAFGAYAGWELLGGREDSPFGEEAAAHPPAAAGH